MLLVGAVEAVCDEQQRQRQTCGGYRLLCDVFKVQQCCFTYHSTTVRNTLCEIPMKGTTPVSVLGRRCLFEVSCCSQKLVTPYYFGLTLNPFRSKLVFYIVTRTCLEQ